MSRHMPIFETIRRVNTAVLARGQVVSKVYQAARSAQSRRNRQLQSRLEKQERWRRWQEMTRMAAVTRNTLWKAGQIPPEVLAKHPNETRQYVFDFSGLLASGTLSTQSVAAVRRDFETCDLTISGAAIVGKTVTALLTAGSDGMIYDVTATVTTSGGETLVCKGRLLATINPDDPWSFAAAIES
jgi:hypothetical protein